MSGKTKHTAAPTSLFKPSATHHINPGALPKGKNHPTMPPLMNSKGYKPPKC